VLGVAGAMYWKSSRVTGAAGNSVLGNLVNAPGSGRGVDMVQAPGEAPKNEMVQAPGQGKERPIEIEDYLKFLKQVQLTQQRMTKSQTGDLEALGMSIIGVVTTEIDPEKRKAIPRDIDSAVARYMAEWNELTAKFQTRVPPRECQELHDHFYDYLGKAQTQLMIVPELLKRGVSAGESEDQQKAREITSQLKQMDTTEVDVAARKADDSLKSVCVKFGISKDFDISVDKSPVPSIFH